MAVTLNQELAQQLREGMETEGGVALPFPHVAVYFMNGDVRLQRVGGVDYFGGWNVDAEKLQELLDHTGLPLPFGWDKATKQNRDGTTYEAYEFRHVVVAPIAFRESFRNQETGERRATFQGKGWRRHAQALVFLAYKDADGVLTPWGPVILTSKGFQGHYMLKAFKQWEQHTDKARRQWAVGVPANCFYLALGTFGAEAVFQAVGSESTTKITPMQLAMPEITEDIIDRTFVGEEVAAQMADYLTQAADWLAAWSTDELAQAEQEQRNQYELDAEGLMVADPEQVAAFKAQALDQGTPESKLQVNEGDPNWARTAVVPMGVYGQGKSLEQLLNEGPAGHRVLRYLAGVETAPNGSSFNPGSDIAKQRLQAAAQTVVAEIPA